MKSLLTLGRVEKMGRGRGKKERVGAGTTAALPKYSCVYHHLWTLLHVTAFRRFAEPIHFAAFSGEV